MSKIKEQCIFYIEDKNDPTPPNTFCIVYGRFINSCPQDCCYFIDKVRTISKLALELKREMSDDG